MSDVIHKDGFPDNWLVQERSAEDAALCRRAEFSGGMFLPHLKCICLKPKLVKISDWLPTARLIAQAIEDDYKASILTRTTDEHDPML